MNDTTFQILVSKPSSPQRLRLPISEYLEGRAEGTIDWSPAAEGAAISIRIDGVERLADDWHSLGSLRMLTRQLQDVRRRLSRGEIGILRAPDIDIIDPPFLLFEPDDPSAPTTVLISLLVIEDPSKDHCFPLPGWGLSDPEELFSYVRANRHELIAAGRELGELDVPLIEAAFPYEALLEAVDLETVQAEALLEIHPEIGMYADV